MAGLEQLVQKSLNPEAPEFVPNRNRNTKLIKLPSTTTSNNNTHYHCSRPPPAILTFQNPGYNFHDYGTTGYNFHDYGTTYPPSRYLHTYSTTVVPHPPSWYTNPSSPSQPHVDPKVVGKKGSSSRRGKRGCSTDRSSWRKYGGRSRPAGVQGCDVNNDEKRHYCCRRSGVVLSNNARKQRPDKQKHPVVPVQEDGESTTVMIRNIPNRFTREMLMDFLDDHCLVENQKAKQLQNGDHHTAAEVEPISAFDFLYLPIDFKTEVNKGYAFVNFTNPKAAWKFYLSAHNLSWGVFQTNKIRQVASARLQGKEELERHFESTSFPCEGKYEYLPVCFSPARDGSRETVSQRTVGRCTAPHHQAKSSAKA